ncbi:putative Tetratricopeptide repeat-like superfamily protein [Tripterygium wilfordii]|uniref:Putative Tetratricopeptide repeat-like superfamily protein n=1 Tax=Tripterygium wilfordii TaxID=458696 RepID=A0A7J7C798_TRIWF|nr:pentatricopeptide repeat-containing protein At1g63330-like [Tripterygium wilfordii]XP_038688352.1 pentatricopeptide repeat-containing protein At1g63330-like [Tripterygium wilfordii]XP_038688353.1 pentatricopeptide repeat-containing protein At1g63330-like [Tripterygium wilfordii]XP_038688354.1 pentatricopeptide repeat-containing protein At1g63330-like [Tripterygium wilfordii]KAF5729727.1 putative Tetratricopeptide repeat-like superfamily protein [Tripterygium wilfordii]
MAVCFYLGKRCLLESGLFKSRAIFLERIFYHSATSALMLEEQVFDESPAIHSRVINNCSGPRTRVGIPKRPKLFPLAVRVVKSLNWEVTRETRFRNAVKMHGFPHSIDAFRIIVHVFASAGMEREAYSLLLDIVYCYKAFNRDTFGLFTVLLDSPLHSERSIVVFDVLTKVFAANSMLENAVDVLYQTKKVGLTPNIRSCNFLLKCLMEANKADSVRMLFEDIKINGPNPNVYTYTIMMNFYCKGHFGHKVDIKQATDIWNDIEKSGEGASVVTCSTYIDGLCKAGFVDAALNLLRNFECRNQPLNSYCYNAVIFGFSRGQLCEALDVFEEMKNHGILPDAYSFSILINGFYKKGHIEDGLHIVHEMLCSDVKLNLVNYSSLFTGLFKVGLIDSSLEMFRGLSASGYKHDLISYNTLVNLLSIQGDTDSASQLLEEMINNGFVPDSFTFGKLIQRCCQSGPLGKALELFDLMRESVHLPSVFVWNVIAHRICKEGYLEQALKLIYDMQDLGIFPNSYTYHPIIKRLCEEKKSEKALELLPSMLKMNALHTNCFNTLIYGFVQQSKPQEACILYGRMRRLGINPNTVTYTILINLFCQRNEMQKAYNLFDDMKKESLIPDEFIYTCLIDGFCKIQRMDSANFLFDEMEINGVTPNAVTYTALIAGHKRLGNIARCYELSDEMKKKGIFPDDTA